MPETLAPRVLLVDDEPAIRGLLSVRLEEAGFEAQQAQDGIEGLVKLRTILPHVIISDIEMPRMSGIEFISVVRKRFPHISVIVSSSASPSDLPQETKPDVRFEKGAINILKLLETIHDLARKTAERPYAPQVGDTPLRTQRDGFGYLVLTCTDCLRSFKVNHDPENQTDEGNAICIYCQARLPLLMESSEPN
jgi:CheY-like chemotaxis protein